MNSSRPRQGRRGLDVESRGQVNGTRVPVVQNRCPPGEARITRGYRLPARHVIHTVGPVYSGAPSDRQVLQSCYKNCLALAVRHHLSTIAFPAISCGAYGYPIDQAAEVALETALDFIRNNKKLKKIHFVLFLESDCDVYRRQLRKQPVA